MKKLIILIFLSYSYCLRADIIVVNITNNQFTPGNFTAVVGDVIRFTLVEGVHTTTSTTIPAGAASWNQLLTTPGQTFDYTITVPGSYSYVCTIHPGMGASFSANAAAPVKLSGFSVKSLKKGEAVLKWQTLTEDNADFFSIQRSETGKDFHEIGRIKAAGNSSLPLNYSFIDQSLSQSNRYYYYQLLTVDLDKKEERSRIILLKQDIQKIKIVVKLAPNPVQMGDHLQIWFNAEREGKLRATLYDVAGKLVYESSMSAFPGVNFGHLHIHDVPSGIYVLKLSIGNLKETMSITVQ